MFIEASCSSLDADISSESKDKLAYIVKNNTNIENIKLKSTKDSVNGLADIVESKVDVTKIYDPNYLKDLDKSLKPVVKKFIGSNKQSLNEYSHIFKACYC